MLSLTVLASAAKQLFECEILVPVCTAERRCGCRLVETHLHQLQHLHAKENFWLHDCNLDAASDIRSSPAVCTYHAVSRCKRQCWMTAVAQKPRFACMYPPSFACHVASPSAWCKRGPHPHAQQRDNRQLTFASGASACAWDAKFCVHVRAVAANVFGSLMYCFATTASFTAKHSIADCLPERPSLHFSRASRPLQAGAIAAP